VGEEVAHRSAIAVVFTRHRFEALAKLNPRRTGIERQARVGGRDGQHELGSQPLAKTRGDNQATLFVKGVLLRARKTGQSSVQKILRNAPLGTTFHHYTPRDSIKARIRAAVFPLSERLFE
jgi:hypothetical protein